MKKNYRIKKIQYELKKYEHFLENIHRGGDYYIEIRYSIKFDNKFFAEKYVRYIDGSNYPDYLQFGNIIDDDKLLPFLTEKLNNKEYMLQYIYNLIDNDIEKYYRDKKSTEEKEMLYKRFSKTKNII